MSRAFLLHRDPALAPWTSHPHWLWVHPGVRGRGGVSLLISCSLLPPLTPSSSVQVGLLQQSQITRFGPFNMPAKGSKPAGTAPHPPALVGSFTLTCLALKPTPPSQRKATHSTGILGFRNRAEAGLPRGSPGARHPA